MKKRLLLLLSALFICNYSAASDSSAELRQIMHEMERANGELQVVRRALENKRQELWVKSEKMFEAEEKRVQAKEGAWFASRQEQRKQKRKNRWDVLMADDITRRLSSFVEKEKSKKAIYDDAQERLQRFMQRKIEDEELDRLQAEGPRFEAEELDRFARKYGRRPYPIIKNFLSEDYYEETFYYGYQALAKTNAMENMKYAVIDYVGTSGLFGLACLIKAWTSLPILHSSNSTYEL